MAQRSLAPWRRGGLSPFAGSPWGQMQEQFNRIFEDFWRDFDDGEMLPAAAQLTPQIDVAEEDEAWRITAEMPGVEEKDVELTVSEGVLTLSGEKKVDTEKKEKNWYMHERAYGSFRRSLRLPPGADLDKIGAKFQNGVLEITVPKRPEAKQSARKIEIGKA